MEGTAHELFHGYQEMNGNTTPSVNLEVEAYVYGEAVRKDAGYGVRPTVGYNTADGYTPGVNFDNSFKNLLSGSTFNQTDFNNAVNNFKDGSLFNGKWSSPNYKGLYDNFPIVNDYNVLIDKLYPL